MLTAGNGATVNSGAVFTAGAYADGIHAISNNGMANVTSSYVRTKATPRPASTPTASTA